MPQRKDIHAVFIIGAGPIVIGQSTEFDYSGSQACKALKKAGYRIALVNSNPATIMTDPALADATYIEPITPEVVADILAREKKIHPNEKMVLLPTMGGQTALNTAMALYKNGTLKQLDIEMIGAKPQAIDKAEDREQFRQAMKNINLPSPNAMLIKNQAEAKLALEKIGLPLIIRPSFTLGGRGGGIAYNQQEYFDKINYGLQESHLATDGQGSVLVEQSVLGWKEFEMEVVRDKKNNAIIVCSIENLDPMGVHTGDSITIAPALTLTDKEYQTMRLASLNVLREIGVETGGSNVQFAINPKDGAMVVIEMNPRVSRSSALASKATGFPIASVAALLAVGYSLDELPNDITGGKIPASFEPSLDYVVTKIPRFAFEKFKGADDTLTTTMKSVGEVMAIGRNFKESFQKALASLETPKALLQLFYQPDKPSEVIDVVDGDTILSFLSTPTHERIYYVARAFAVGYGIEEIYRLTNIDKWFLSQIKDIINIEKNNLKFRKKNILQGRPEPKIDITDILQMKKQGYSDANIALQLRMDEEAIRTKRKKYGIVPIFKRIDSCAGEFPSPTPYLYSCYEGSIVNRKYEKGEDEANITDSNKKIIILGGGPNRIGQGIEFDYACVHAAYSLKQQGYETIMINCNPETVSTDYDTADRLYFEPLTAEHVLNILDKESEKGKILGVIVQYGGQTPLKLADDIIKAGYNILGTDFTSISNSENRQYFSRIIEKLQLQQPPNQTITFDRNKPLDEYYKKFGTDSKKNKESLSTLKKLSNQEDDKIKKNILSACQKIGFPIIIRPSEVLGGRAMEIIYDETSFNDAIGNFIREVIELSANASILIDKYLNDAIEVDVDAIADIDDDGTGEVYVAGIMEHIEEAGVHSGDSACALPTFSLSPNILTKLEQQTKILGKAFRVKGLMNIQFAIKGEDIFILEMNPRSSRTVPFVAKATNYPLAEMGARVMAGEKLSNLPCPKPLTAMTDLPFISVKEAVFPFDRFINFSNNNDTKGALVALGPEMRSTGEVMGISETLPAAFAKSQLASGAGIPSPKTAKGNIFISIKDSDKKMVLPLAKKLQQAGFHILATHGTANYFEKNNISGITKIDKLSQKNIQQPSIKELLLTKKIAMVFNTMEGGVSRGDAKTIRALAVKNHIPNFTTTRAMQQVVNAISHSEEKNEPLSLQEWHKKIPKTTTKK
ncbi:MAG: carbamoyl-phosphate synthase large subunit [Alphaproteobacteria bacterium]